MKRSPTGSISFALSEVFTYAAVGLRVGIRSKPFKSLISCRNLAAIIESDEQVVSRASRVGTEERPQRSRRVHLACRLAADPGSDVCVWRRILACPNYDSINKDVMKRSIRGRPMKIDHLDRDGRAGIVRDLPLGDVASAREASDTDEWADILCRCGGACWG